MISGRVVKIMPSPRSFAERRRENFPSNVLGKSESSVRDRLNISLVRRDCYVVESQLCIEEDGTMRSAPRRFAFTQFELWK